MKRKHTRSTRRDELAAVAMHGILAACASPQFYDRLEQRCEQEKVSMHRFIANMAYEIAAAMQLEGGS